MTSTEFWDIWTPSPLFVCKMYIFVCKFAAFLDPPSLGKSDYPYSKGVHISLIQHFWSTLKVVLITRFCLHCACQERSGGEGNKFGTPRTRCGAQARFWCMSKMSIPWNKDSHFALRTSYMEAPYGLATSSAVSFRTRGSFSRFWAVASAAARLLLLDCSFYVVLGLSGKA